MCRRSFYDNRALGRMADCNHCGGKIDGTANESISGAFLCDDCYNASEKCSGCSRAASPNYLNDDGRCSSCMD